MVTRFAAGRKFQIGGGFEYLGRMGVSRAGLLHGVRSPALGCPAFDKGLQEDR